ncbi:hypothetical protein [Caldisericum exile]|uniref:Uncharacterized protein n=1 Tax=Caldisericum exile (strain DSM 21853 / NBRC 104410 / AZM16c01) TaxID=511051 RepID=A0A7U6GD72_CALEA|nr:hypothetical protein [Caldisericum exile]BAL80176.1 hypothetical protein CSE_00500 [Caldisericum exile AZM16c01]
MLPFAREDSERIIYTNLGIDEELNDIFIKAEKEEYFMGETIIESYHNRGNDELINRALKEFGTEEMPFKRFLPGSILLFSSLVILSLRVIQKRCSKGYH